MSLLIVICGRLEDAARSAAGRGGRTDWTGRAVRS
jgi:hypothetical protein